MLRGSWWPFGLLFAGALVLWGLGYRHTDGGAILFMAGLIAAAGAYIIMVQQGGKRGP